MLSAEITASQNDRISELVEHESSRLRNFIRQRVDDAGEAEDILQDVFYELVVAARMMESVERAGAWLLRVARNRIIDRFRKKRALTFSEVNSPDDNGDRLLFEDLLPSPDAGPEAAYARALLIEELQSALDELPAAQREVFVAHEIEGQDFKQIAARTGVTVNALILRKRQAVLHLRQRLSSLHDYFSKS